MTLHLPSIQSAEEFESEVRDLIRKPSKFGRLRWRDLDRPGPEHEYIIEGFFSVGDKSIVGGPSQSGKSFLSIHAGMSIAYATIDPKWTFFGHKIVRPGLVVYQAGEGARGVKKRLRAFRKHFSIPADIDLPFELLQSPVDLYSAEGDTTALLEEIESIKADYPDIPLVAVFIDTLATATAGADENSGKDMSAVMKNIDRIRAATGANICLVHHLNAAGTKLRGHSSIFANIDQVIKVERDEATKIRTVTLGKQKDDDDSLTLRFELYSVELSRHPETQKPITSCVCVEVGQKDALKKAEEAVGYNLIKQEERRIFAALLKALDMFGAYPTPEMIEKGLPAERKVVHLENWREVYAEMNPDPDGPPSAKSIGQRLRNNKDFMVQGKVIGIWAQHIWWTGKPVRQFRETHPEPRQDPILSQSGPNDGPIDQIDPF